MTLSNGALSTTDPPQLEVMVSVPLLGGFATCTDPSNVKKYASQNVVSISMKLQFAPVLVPSHIQSTLMTSLMVQGLLSSHSFPVPT